MHVAASLCRGPAKGKEITLTSVKERDVIILHGSQVHVLPEVRLLWGMGCQKALPVEPFLWATETRRGRVDGQEGRNVQGNIRGRLIRETLTRGNQAVEPARRVVKVIRNQRVCAPEQVQQHKEVLGKEMETKT